MEEPIKGAYLASAAYVEGVEYGSVAGKIAAQVNALKRAGFDCELIPVATPETRWRSVINWAPFLPTLEGWENNLLKSEYRFLYIRKPIFTRKFIHFLRVAKECNPGIKIILEIPTYPYDQEMKGTIAGISLAKDRYYRTQLFHYVDRIADLSHSEEIFSIPTLPIINGIDLSTISTRKPSLQKDEIHILSASGMCMWHGIDRAIRGLEKYRSDTSGGATKVILHLAGNGPELPTLQSMVRNAHLEDSVIFHGELTQIELNRLYGQCTLALEGLGYHRKNLYLSSSLKSREYLAVGIPFVYSTLIDILNTHTDFHLRVPEDDTPLDFNLITSFHEHLYSTFNEDEVIRRIRDFAVRHASIDKAMGPVIDYIQSEA